VDILWPEQSQ